MVEKYCRQLQKRPEEIDYNCKIDVWTSIKYVYTKSANNGKAPWVITEILELNDKRKELKATKNMIDENRVKYNDLTRDINNKKLS